MGAATYSRFCRGSKPTPNAMSSLRQDGLSLIHTMHHEILTYSEKAAMNSIAAAWPTVTVPLGSKKHPPLCTATARS